LLYKKAYGQHYIPKIEIIDELLCFGWLDGVVRVVDEHTYLLLASPRRIDHWAESYKKRIALLEAQNRLADAGKQAVERSKANGGWNYMDDFDKLIKPLDFQKSLEANPPALANFDAFATSNKRNMLWHIKLAKTDKTRKKRIDLITKLAMEGKILAGS